MNTRKTTEQFIKTAGVYDVVYADKPYRQEAYFYDGLLRRYGVKRGAKLLDIGCGTGQHEVFLAKQGYRVTGVDVSGEMLRIARKRLEGIRPPVRLYQKDARTFRLKETFGAAVSLFHVLSYMTKNEDIILFFENVRRHLVPGGIFLFDCWYGPGVLTDRPAPQYRLYKEKGAEIHRIKLPDLYIHENTVRVRHTYVRTKAAGGGTDTFSENHVMRYFFQPEIVHFLDSCGFKLLDFGEPGRGKLNKPKDDAWSVMFVARGKETVTLSQH